MTVCGEFITVWRRKPSRDNKYSGGMQLVKSLQQDPVYPSSYFVHIYSLFFNLMRTLLFLEETEYSSLNFCYSTKYTSQISEMFSRTDNDHLSDGYPLKAVAIFFKLNKAYYGSLLRANIFFRNVWILYFIIVFCCKRYTFEWRLLKRTLFNASILTIHVLLKGNDNLWRGSGNLTFGG